MYTNAYGDPVFEKGDSVVVVPVADYIGDFRNTTDRDNNPVTIKIGDVGIIKISGASVVDFANGARWAFDRRALKLSHGPRFNDVIQFVDGEYGRYSGFSQVEVGKRGARRFFRTWEDTAKIVCTRNSGMYSSYQWYFGEPTPKQIEAAHVAAFAEYNDPDGPPTHYKKKGPFWSDFRRGTASAVYAQIEQKTRTRQPDAALISALHTKWTR